MVVYADLVVLLNFGVDLLLLLGTNRLAGYSLGLKRAVGASVIGGIYAYMCLLPGFRFFSGTIWRLVILVIMSVITFGLDRSALTRGVLFVFLSMALGGIAMGLNSGSFWTLIASAAGVLIMCIIGFRGTAGKTHYLPVELYYHGKCKHLTALVDTGNTLRDPITGQQVLVVGAQIAHEMLGLSTDQLRDPISVVGSGQYCGLRLIPYRAVGQPGGMLLAVQFEDVKIGGKPAGKLVAFAPDALGSREGYQALAGGVL